MLHEQLRHHTLILAETLGKHLGVSAQTVFAKFIGDPKAAYRLIDGEDFKVKTLDRWVQLLSNAWPADLVWPVGSFSRPAPLTAAEMDERDEADRADRAARAEARRAAKEDALAS